MFTLTNGFLDVLVADVQFCLDTTNVLFQERESLNEWLQLLIPRRAIVALGVNPRQGI